MISYEKTTVEAIAKSMEHTNDAVHMLKAQALASIAINLGAIADRMGMPAEEPKTPQEWLEVPIPTRTWTTLSKCPECGHLDVEEPPYCSRCGAKLGEESENE